MVASLIVRLASLLAHLTVSFGQTMAGKLLTFSFLVWKIFTIMGKLSENSIIAGTRSSWGKLHALSRKRMIEPTICSFLMRALQLAAILFLDSLEVFIRVRVCVNILWDPISILGQGGAIVDK